MFEKKFLTDRLIIREYKKTDIDGFLRVVRQPEIYATTYGIPLNYSRVRAEWWLKTIKENKKADTAHEFAMILKNSGEYIGNVGLINISRLHNRAEISYYIDREYMNQGYTTEAALVMLKYGFKNLKLHKISGVCMSVNPASRRVMEKIGMTYEGTLREELFKDNEYYDLDRLSILRNEFFTDCKPKKSSFQHQNVERV